MPRRDVYEPEAGGHGGGAWYSLTRLRVGVQSGRGIYIFFFFFFRKILHPKTMKLIEQTGVEKYFFLFSLCSFSNNFGRVIINRVYEGSTTFPLNLKKLERYSFELSLNHLEIIKDRIEIIF